MDATTLLGQLGEELAARLEGRATVWVEPPSERWKTPRLRIVPMNRASASIEAWEDAESLLFGIADNYGPRLEWSDDVAERAIGVVLDVANHGYRRRHLLRATRSWPPY